MLMAFPKKCNSDKKTLIKGFGIQLFTAFIIQSCFSVSTGTYKMLTSLNCRSSNTLVMR